MDITAKYIENRKKLDKKNPKRRLIHLDFPHSVVKSLVDTKPTIIFASFHLGNSV